MNLSASHTILYAKLPHLSSISPAVVVMIIAAGSPVSLAAGAAEFIAAVAEDQLKSLFTK